MTGIYSQINMASIILSGIEYKKIIKKCKIQEINQRFNFIVMILDCPTSRRLLVLSDTVLYLVEVL